jgi:hypothetical protein
MLVFAGCGDAPAGAKNRPPVYPVTGKVMHKGTPLADAFVSFRSGSPDNQVGAAGKTDANGEFTMTTFEPGDGAVEGNHMVTVIKAVVEGEDLSYFDEKSKNYGKTPPPTKTKYLIPQKYSKFETAGLSATVKKDGSNEITLELKD